MKTKLKLNDLKVTSFVTALENNEKLTVNGGGVITSNSIVLDICPKKVAIAQPANVKIMDPSEDLYQPGDRTRILTFDIEGCTGPIQCAN